MNPRKVMSSSLPAGSRPMVARAGLALLMITPIWLMACSGTPTGVNHAAEATADIPDPIRALEARAELETLNPTEPADPGLLRAINPDMRPALTPGTPEYQRAVMDADEIEIDESILGLGEGRAGEEIDEQRRTQALKLYTRARTLRQNGRLEEAAETLRQAMRVDPSSAAIQRELGDTLIVSGDLVGAVRAFERGVELGDRSPRALVHIASHASTRNDHERVMALTTKALNDPAIDDHPMVRAIAGTLLGNAQISAGYLRAGAETLEEALGSFDSGSRDLRWRREIIQIIGQRSQLWVVVGDAWASVGAHGRAAKAYGRAAEAQEDTPVALIGRQIAAKLRAGQPAGAGLLLLDHIQDSVGDLGATEQRWAGALCEARGMGDLLSGAIAKLAQRPGLTPSIRRSLLALEVSCLDTDDALARIASGGPETNNPATIARVLGEIDDADDRYRSAARLLESNPSIARAVAAAIIQASAPPTDLLAEHGRAKSEGARLLNTSIGLAIGRADLIGHLGSLRVEDAADRGTVWLSLHAQALALTGRWEAAETLADELDRRAQEGDADAVGELASTLLILQHPGRAWELARGLGDDEDASTRELALAGRIAQMLRHHEEAAAYLGRAHEQDPYDANIAEQLVLLRGASSPAADEEELQRIVRRLGTHRPRSPLFGLMRASELARNSMVREAEALLLELNDKYPMAEIGHDLLLSIWKTQQTQGDEDAMAGGIAWLGQQLETQPNSIGTAQTLARAHFELDQYERALAVLENTYARTGSFEIARLIEQLLVEQLSRPEEADAHVIERLDGLVGVDHTIEHAAYLADRGTAEAGAEMLELLRANLPAEITLLPGQIDQLSRVVLTLAESAEALDNRGVVLDTIAVIEERTPAIDFQLARIKVLLMAQRPGFDLEELIAVIDVHMEHIEDKESRQLLRALPIQSLLGEDRAHEAIALIVRMATRNGELDRPYIIETYRLLGAMGRNSDMIGVLDVLESRGLLQEVIELTTSELGTPERPIADLSTDQQRADLSYTAAAMASAFEREGQAREFYELALSYDPDHGWSNNDYGYMLADSGERIGEAVEMLERAAEALPNEASVIDSLAWVRYKMGIFEDVVDPDTGEVITHGAISLLERARRLDAEEGNPTILLHLGDALWRAGERERAVESWLAAENMIRGRIRFMSIEPEPNRRVMEALGEELRLIRYRIQDAESTGEPSIGPIVGDPAEADAGVPPSGPGPDGSGPADPEPGGE